MSIGHSELVPLRFREFDGSRVNAGLDLGIEAAGPLARIRERVCGIEAECQFENVLAEGDAPSVAPGSASSSIGIDEQTGRLRVGELACIQTV